MPRLKLFGSPAIEGDEGQITGPAAQRHRIAMLALLAAAHPDGLTRDKLRAYLWPERDSEHARKLLNQAVHTLRRAIGPSGIVAAGDVLRLDADSLDCDVIAFERAIAAAEPEEATRIYSGPFLDGFFLGDAAEFERWADAERQRLAGDYGRALEAVAGEAEARDDHTTAVERWRTRAALDPYDARIAVALMRALEASGNRAGALQHAAIHARLLRDDFDMPSAPEVVRFRERLRTETDARIEKGDETESETGDGTESETGDGTDSETAEDGPYHPGRATTAVIPPRRRPVRSLARLVVPAALLGVAMLAAAFWLRPQTPALHAHRVVVSPFENRTGDDALDAVGSMASDWITQRLSHTGIVEVVPTSAAAASTRFVRAVIAADPGIDPVRALAEETGAGVVVSGAFYRSGDSLQFQVEITDARRRRVIHVSEPVAGPGDAPSGVIELLGRRAVGALAAVLDDRLTAHSQLGGRPPTYEAYRAYAEGMELFIESRWRESIGHFERAVALDSTYLSPRLSIALAHVNLGESTVADSIGRELNHVRERLSPYDRALLDMMASWFGDDPTERYDAAKRAAALAPGSLPHVQWGIEAVRLNRPREALEIFSQIDPARGEVRGWNHYWRYVTEAHHMLGRHRRELREARRARALYPDDPLHLLLEARSLAALGRLGQVEEAIDARLSLAPHRQPEPGTMMIAIGHELRVHGHDAAALATYRRALDWYRARPDAERVRHRANLARALLLTGEWQAAHGLFEQLATEEPDDFGHPGALGMLAARTGEHAEARRIAARLAADTSGPRWSTRGYRARSSRTYWRACIAAQLGQQAEAVALLREAFGQGIWYGFHPHTDHCLDPLRDFEPFRELMRPKG